MTDNLGFVEPMLAVKLDYDKIQTKAAGYSMELKLDGVRCIMVKRGTSVELFTRTGHRLTEKLPHLVNQFSHFKADLIIDGEVGYTPNLHSSDRYLPIIDFNSTMRVIGSGVGEALDKQQVTRFTGNGNIGFWAFDMLYAGGGFQRGWMLDTPQRERHSALELVGIDALNIDLNELVRVRGNIDDIHIVLWVSSWDEDNYVEYVDMGGEGIILKNPNAPYKAGKRPANHWFKVKKYHSVDAVIINNEVGQGKYEGQVGAVVFGLTRNGGANFITVGKASGMDDTTRLDMTYNWHTKYLNQVAEFRYFGKVGKDGSGLRHPQFLRMRPDKHPKDCTFDSLS